MLTEVAQRFKNLIFGLPQSQISKSQEISGKLPRSKFYNLLLSSLLGQTGGAKWTGGLSRSGAPTIIDASETLQNARKAFHQSTQARTLITRRRDITIDRGLKVEPNPAWGILGITDEKFKEKWTTDHEERFDLYMSSKQCHRSSTMTGYQIQRLYGLFDGRDNDQFIRFFYSKDKKLISPLQLEFVDPTQIGNHSTIVSSGGSVNGISGNAIDTLGNLYNINDGIYRDDKNVEVGYRVKTRKKLNGSYLYQTLDIPAVGGRSGRIFMIHGYEQEYAGQGRGYSPLHFAVQDLENITDFTSSQIKKAIKQSDMIGFVEPGDKPSSNPFEDLQSGPGFEQNIAITDDESSEKFVLIRPEYTTRVPGSDFIANLNSNEKIKFLEDTAPGPQFDAFVTSIMSYLSSAYNLPIEVVLMKFNANYSASRAALLMAWQIGRIKQDDIKADLMDYWWEMWLSEEIAAGRTQAPGWLDPRLKQAWMRYRLQGPPLPSISPRDDLASIGDKLKFGLTTQEREARSLNGSSAKANATQNKKQFSNTPTVPWEDTPETMTTPKPGNGSSDNE